MMLGTATHAVHANTGIGIERTRQFVRDTCATWNLPRHVDENGSRHLPASPRRPTQRGCRPAAHMSGECLCGSFAKPGELDEIGEWFPDVAATIRALETEVRAAGFPEPLCRWGHGEGRASAKGRLCSSCSVASIPLFD